MKSSSLRWALVPGAVAAVVLALAFLSSGTARAQVLPPHALSGSVTLDGQPATVGTPVVALVGGNICGQTTVNQQSRYVIQVKHSSAQAGCGNDGDTITFEVGGNPANETFTFKTGGSDDLNLTAETVQPTPVPPTPRPPEATATPRPIIITGTGGYLDENGGGTGWWALAVGSLALTVAGAAGLLAFRRVHR